MKQIITSEEDLKSLYGKFIVQLNATNSSPCMATEFKKNPGFWLEKRISFVGRLYGGDGYPFFSHKEVEKDDNKNLLILNGFYYCHGIYTNEQFIAYWNHYQFGEDPKKWDEHRDTRYHRLLTPDELKWLMGQLNTL